MIRIVALTDTGHRLGKKIAALMSLEQTPYEVWFKPQPFIEKVQQAFCDGDALIFICATGIVVRALAPVLNSKHTDPPVLVMDEAGHFIIPLLSGHEGGANQWASDLAKHLSAQLVITTAKPYIEPVYAVGMGCERHCGAEELQQLLETCVAKIGLSMAQIHSINSIDIKVDEVGLIACANRLGKSYQTFNQYQLRQVEHLLSIKSDYVYNTVGVYGVAESAALVGAQYVTDGTPELVLNKVKTKKATCAIAKAYPQHTNLNTTNTPIN